MHVANVWQRSLFERFYTRRNIKRLFGTNNSATHKINDPVCGTFINIDAVYTCWHLEIVQSLLVIIVSIVVNGIWICNSAILISNVAFTCVTAHCINTAGIDWITIDSSSWFTGCWWRYNALINIITLECTSGTTNFVKAIIT